MQDQYLHIFDTFEYDYIQQLTSKAGMPELILSDHYSYYDTNGQYPIIGSVLFAENQARIQQHSKYVSEHETKYSFNFSCNKKQINRHLLIKMVELFGLDNFVYTWSGAGQHFDLSGIIEELNQIGWDDSVFRSELLSGINKIKPCWIDYKLPPDVDPIATVSVKNYGGNVWTWNNGLNNIYENSAISLIGESVRFTKAATFTEKTIYAVMGCTLPIWIGGYQQAREWERIGFDIFSDVIDHSYQEYDTLFERCYYAFKNNLHLLSDVNLASHVRQTMLNRLLKNKTNLVEILTNFNNSVLEQTPYEFQNLFKPILARAFRPQKD